MNPRSRTLAISAAAGAVALIAVGLAVAKADNLTLFARAPAEPAVYRSDNTPAQDRLLARTAYTSVLAHGPQALGMIPPANAPAYAPIYPDGLILKSELSPSNPSGGAIEYDAAGPVRAVLDFYEDAAARARLPFTVSARSPDVTEFKAGQGAHGVQVTLTRQFANGTVVDLSYS